MGKKSKSGGGGKKVGRNKKWCEGYRRADRHSASHIARITKHLEGTAKLPAHPDRSAFRDLMRFSLKAALELAKRQEEPLRSAYLGIMG